MRVIAGQYRGRVLKGPASSSIRPTSDRLRETLFNILTHGHDDPVTNARVIDVFAGTGALGLEALSRGARFALFVDDGAHARALLRANIETLGLGGQSRLLRADARKLGMAPTDAAFTLAFLDPPYGQNLASPALQALRRGGWLAKEALVVVEEGGGTILGNEIGYQMLEQRDFGDTNLAFYKLSATAQPAGA